MIDALLQSHATLALLAINVALSFAAFSSPQLIDKLMLHIRPILTGGEYHRTITSGFVHGDTGHLFMNMLTLFFFGPTLEQGLGTEAFLLIYFAALLAGSAWSIMENFRNPEYRALGASGAISGLTVTYALFQPFQMLFVFVIPMPAIIFAVVYIAYSAYASGGRVRDNIGHGAHLGGALMGVVIVCLFYPNEIRQIARDVTEFLTRI